MYSTNYNNRFYCNDIKVRLQKRRKTWVSKIIYTGACFFSKVNKRSENTFKRVANFILLDIQAGVPLGRCLCSIRGNAICVSLSDSRHDRKSDANAVTNRCIEKLPHRDADYLPQIGFFCDPIIFIGKHKRKFHFT